MNLKNYTVTDDKFWTGRVDDPDDIDSYRMHQIIQLLDLRRIEQTEFDLSNINICFIANKGVANSLVMFYNRY